MKETKFKQTEVGMIPRDWGILKLNDLCYLITKQTGFDYSAAIKPSLVRNSSNSTLPFIQNKDFEGTKINFETDFYIPKFVAINYPKILLNEPVLLISISGRIGNVAYFSHQKDAFIGGAVGVARFNDKRLIEWTNLYLLSTGGQSQIFANEKSGAQHNLTIADVRNLKIAFPPTIKEQQRIANALSDVDTLIANLEKLIAKKKNIKKGAMQQLLTGKKRLPGFGSDERTGSRPTDERRKECHSERSAKREVEESSGYKMTELGLIPSDWLQMKLRDLCYLITKQTGFDYSATIKPSLVTEESKETLPFIQNKDFEGTSINFATDFFIPKNIAANFPKILLNEPVLLISISGKIGNVAYFSHERDAFIGGAVGVARFNEKKYIKWTNLFLQSEYGQKQIFANEKSGAQHNLTIEDVRNLNVYMPSSCEEQTAIANVLSDMDAEISALETKLAKYRTLKTGMMQQLLTGKIRLVK